MLCRIIYIDMTSSLCTYGKIYRVVGIFHILWDTFEYFGILLNTLGYFAQLDGSPKVWGYLKIKIVAENDSDYSDRWSRLLLRVVVTHGLLPGTRQMMSGTARY